MKFDVYNSASSWRLRAECEDRQIQLSQGNQDSQLQALPKKSFINEPFPY